MNRLPIALTIAGSDSGGGAGIQADLKTFQRFRVFGTTVVTAITAQNTLGVLDWTAVPQAMIRAQLEAVVTDLRPAAVKSGMLADAAVVDVVRDFIQQYRLAPYILDPVMVATSGDLLLERDAVAAIRDALFPLAELVTPNLDEARIFTGIDARDVASMTESARRMVDLGAAAALVKGGHLAGDETADVLFDGAEVTVFRHRRIDTRHTHGTGCTLSAAIAAHRALGYSLIDAVTRSLEYVHRAIESAPGLGAGHGPLDHSA